MRPMTRVLVFRLCALGFLFPALYHAAGIVNPSLTEPAPAWRHALFVGINLSAAAGMLVRPRFFVWLFGALVAQQLYGHGRYGWEVWQREHRVDWASVVVLVAMPPLFALLLADRRERAPARSSPPAT